MCGGARLARVNNAGTNAYKYGLLAEACDADLVDIVQTNVLGVMLGCKEARVPRSRARSRRPPRGGGGGGGGGGGPWAFERRALMRACMPAGPCRLCCACGCPGAVLGAAQAAPGGADADGERFVTS